MIMWQVIASGLDEHKASEIEDTILSNFPGVKVIVTDLK